MFTVFSSHAGTAVTNAPAANTNGLTIYKYDIAGNTVLPPDQFAFLTNYTGKAVPFSRLREGLVDLQLRYRELGFPTITVTLPPQKLTNGVVHVRVIEGHLSRIRVTGNRFFSTNEVLRALPSLQTNILLNTKWFQPELDQANANRDRQIYPVIGPGPDPGTTELTLKVKDRLPLHGRVEINDKSSPVTPLLRTDASVEYDNLWQHDHQVGFDYDFSPQELKTEAHPIFDEPMVASYSGYYRLPLGGSRALRQDYEDLPPTFGFDEISHKFNLPPPTGRPSLIFFSSRSVSDTPVRYGPLSIITSNSSEAITSQSASRTLTIDDDVGMKVTIPIREWAGIFSSFSLGADYKSYSSPSFGTNLTDFSALGLDAYNNPTTFGSQLLEDPNNSRAYLQYIPLSLGWSGSRPDAGGGLNFYYNQNLFLGALASARTNFQDVAGGTRAGGTYTTGNLGITRQQRLIADWTASLGLSGQWASAPLIANEQFGLGGSTSVRGYEEGEIYGDDGWSSQLDLRAPAVNIGYFPTSTGDVPAMLHCSVFMDYGQVYLIDRSANDLSYDEWGTGTGFFLTAGEHFDARFTVAWALQDTLVTHVGEARAYFSLGYQF